MSSKYYCARPMVAAAMACAVFFVGAAAAHAESMASVWGYVYLDKNSNGTPEKTDYAIVGAMVTMTRDSDPSFLLTTTTDTNGLYRFSVATGDYMGTYSIKLNPYTADSGGLALGVVYDANGTATAESDWGTADSATNTFVGVTLAAGDQAMNYNYAKTTYPLELVSKRFLISTGSPGPVPEPSAFALLVGGIGVLGAVGWRRLRRRAGG